MSKNLIELIEADTQGDECAVQMSDLVAVSSNR